MMMAFADGNPRVLATPDDTTASTPPMPTVPKPATGSFSVRAPMTLTGLFSDIRSWLPIV